MLNDSWDKSGIHYDLLSSPPKKKQWPFLGVWAFVLRGSNSLILLEIILVRIWDKIVFFVKFVRPQFGRTQMKFQNLRKFRLEIQNISNCFDQI
jgi:hypothetical protein